jgi:hypothetical protein
MKTGDKKQAIALGVVALGAVGFLGKSVLETFLGGSTAQPVATANREGKPESRAAIPDQSQNPPSPITPPQNPGSAVFPEVKEGNSAPQVAQVTPKQDVPIELYNDGFAAPVLKTGGQESTAKPVQTEKPSVTTEKKSPVNSKASKPMKGVVPLPVTGDKEANSSGKPDENTGNDQQTKKEDSKSTLRFCGLVESRKKMAIIEFDGQSMTVSQGQMIDDELVVVDVNFNSIKVQRGSKKYVIALGGKRDL